MNIYLFTVIITVLLFAAITRADKSNLPFLNHSDSETLAFFILPFLVIPLIVWFDKGRTSLWNILAFAILCAFIVNIIAIILSNDVPQGGFIAAILASISYVVTAFFLYVLMKLFR